jgi:catechol 2,3-dioxygenase
MKRRNFLHGLVAAVPTCALAPAVWADGLRNGLPKAAPIHVGAVGLKARDAEALAGWYKSRMGLRETSRSSSTIWLGAGTPLLAITEEEGLKLAGAQMPGLYHTAFLLPSRSDLGRWILHAIEQRIPVDGASDHLVSDAIYMTDPEGNGVELYSDRPQSSWKWSGGFVEMATDPLDVDAVVNSAGANPGRWKGAPRETIIGHVHLKVGDAAKAAGWWQELFGFDKVRQRDRAVFLSTGRYHHHVAVNAWLTSGASHKPVRTTGLDFIELRRRTPAKAVQATDPWGIRVLMA